MAPHRLRPRRHPRAAASAILLAALALLTACGDGDSPGVVDADAATVPPPASAGSAQAAVAGVDAAPAGATRLDLAPGLDESQLGVPLYPGATLEGGAGSRIVLPQGTTLMATLHTRDAAPQVAAWYRDALHARAPGREFADLGDAGGAGSTTLVLADTAAGHAVQVRVAPAAEGASVQIVSTQAVR